MTFRTSLISLISFLAGAVLIAPALSTNSVAPAARAGSASSVRAPDREVDRQAIRAHIEKIFQGCATNL